MVRPVKPARHREVTFEPFEASSISNYEAKFKAAEEVAALAESGQVMQRLVDGWDGPLRNVGIHLTAPELTGAIVGAESGGIHEKFTATARSKPGSVALTYDGGALTFRGLDERSDGVAAELRRRGVVAETPVPVLLRRGPDYVVAMLGVLKAGGLIVPLDPSMPADRVGEILNQTKASVVVDDALMAAAQNTPVGEFTPEPTHPGQGAYVVFTSGTTGKPKGVIGTHGAVLSYAADHAARVLQPAVAKAGRPLRVAHAWSFTFDAAWQPLAALLDGHGLHIVSDEVQRDAEALVATIGQYGVDLIDTTPSMFTQLQAEGLLTTVPLTALALGGEAVDPNAWAAIRGECDRTGMSAYNCYGPTETTVEAVVAAFTAHDTPSIGHPTASTRAYVLDAWLRPVPDGVTGELYLSGGQLTRGYLGRAGETAARFVAEDAGRHLGQRRVGEQRHGAQVRADGAFFQAGGKAQHEAERAQPPHASSLPRGRRACHHGLPSGKRTRRRVPRQASITSSMKPGNRNAAYHSSMTRPSRRSRRVTVSASPEPQKPSGASRQSRAMQRRAGLLPPAFAGSQ